MSDDFEDLLRRWLRDRSRTDRRTLQALAGNVAVLPPRRRNRPNRLVPLAATIVVLIALIALAGPRFGGIGGEASASPTPSAVASDGSVLPGSAEAFADDSRLASCVSRFTPLEQVEYAFEMQHARDYNRYLPGMGRSPELELDDPALVVIFKEDWVPLLGGSSPSELPSMLPSHRYLCIVVTGGLPSIYGDVDITGLTIDVVSSEPSPAVANPTPSPAWLGSAAAALRCDGPPSTFSVGGQGALDTTEQPSPEAALGEFLRRVRDFHLPLPTEQFDEYDRTTDAVAFGYFANGSARAIVTVRSIGVDGTGLWYLADVASCDPSEFGPDVRLGAEVVIWRDAEGHAVPTTTLHDVSDCYNGRKLMVEGRLYVWDPNLGREGIYDPAQLESTFASDVALPAGAIDTGYTDDPRRLLLAEDGTAAYVVQRDSVQRWPHVKGDEYQRTDCN